MHYSYFLNNLEITPNLRTRINIHFPISFLNDDRCTDFYSFVSTRGQAVPIQTKNKVNSKGLLPEFSVHVDQQAACCQFELNELQNTGIRLL